MFLAIPALPIFPGVSGPRHRLRNFLLADPDKQPLFLQFSQPNGSIRHWRFGCYSADAHVSVLGFSVPLPQPLTETWSYLWILPGSQFTYSNFTNGFSIDQQNVFTTESGGLGSNATAHLVQSTAGSISTTYTLVTIPPMGFYFNPLNQPRAAVPRLHQLQHLHQL